MPPLTISRDPASAQFFDGARSGQLLIQECTQCRHRQFALTGLSAGVARCRHCMAPSPLWVPASGAGEVVSFTVIPGRSTPERPPPAPTIAAIVELDEGPWVTAPLDAPPAEVAVGNRVQVEFRQPSTDGEPLPTFVPHA